MTHPENTRSVVIERELHHPAEKIWRAITDGALIEEWLMKNDFQPVAGHKFTLRSTPVPNWDGIINCEVLVVDPPKTLAYTWTSMGVATRVTMTLTPTAAGVTLRVEQSGFPAGGDQYVQGATYGWQRFAGNLERLLGSSTA